MTPGAARGAISVRTATFLKTPDIGTKNNCPHRPYLLASTSPARAYVDIRRYSRDGKMLSIYLIPYPSSSTFSFLLLSFFSNYLTRRRARKYPYHHVARRFTTCR
jgi:hypothetical protein